MHYPENKKYTVKPLNVTHLAGRDPETGRVVSLYDLFFSLMNPLNRIKNENIGFRLLGCKRYWRWSKA